MSDLSGMLKDYFPGPVTPPLSVYPDLPAPPGAAFLERPPAAALSTDRPPAAVRALTVGGVCVGLAALPYKLFELDRFFVPKEVAVELVAAVALITVAKLRTAVPAPPGTVADRGIRARVAAAPLDASLAAFLLISVASAVLADSLWLAARAVALSAAGVALFWVARAAGRAGWGPAVLRAAAGLVAVAVLTALLQTYGVRTEYFSLNRAPGGTFGNRNFVAHLCAIGLPLLAYLAFRARSVGAAATAAATFAAAAGTLVLTRSRAAWLASAVAAVPFLIGVLRAAAARQAQPDNPAAGGLPATQPVRRDDIRLRRAAVLVLATGVAALAAVRLPNALDWRSDSPYLDSARGMVNYREGSGQGRLKQWHNSARLVAAHPILGVGPGHWSVHYPGVAPPGDPSLTNDRTTANPWPSSDWVAFASERGLLGVGALGVVMLLLAWRAHTLAWRAPTADARLLGGTLGAVLAATLTAGAFDAVLLLAAPSFLAWTTLGALAGSADLRMRDWHELALPFRRRFATSALAVLLVGGAALGAAHGSAMALYSTGRSQAMAQAAVLAPGDYRIVLRAAQSARQTGGCTSEVRRWTTAAYTLAPSAPAAARLVRSCPAARSAARRSSRVSARP